jgi:hypothetical protein
MVGRTCTKSKDGKKSHAMEAEVSDLLPPLHERRHVHTMNTSLPSSSNPAGRPRRSRWVQWLAATSVAAVLAACGGGGSSSADGVASTGLSVGTVTGFGSIIVDGVRYDDRNVRISVDTESGAPDASSRRSPAVNRTAVPAA